ncbi:MAG: histidine phosphatase family protein [Ardenticatenales bacterium]|nr:histidine phosphatase family protein [Ardenticatenales bacterium]
MHLFIVRHGECLGQCEPEHYNDPDSPLSSLGEWQAQRVAERLASENITHIVSSPLIRALTTASKRAEATTVRPIEVWHDVREGFSTTHQGLAREVLQERFPLATFPDVITADGWMHGGDSYESFCGRCHTMLQAFREHFGPKDRVVLVTHGGFANYLLHAILRIDSSTPRWFELENCAISHVRFAPDPAKERPNWPLYPPVEAEILSVNDVSHLMGSIPT